VSFEKISLTAKLTAYMRQFSDIPFAKEVAQAVRAEAAFDELLRTHQLVRDDLLWYAPIFEVRYKSIAQRLRASGIAQVLELASGLSLRGLAMTEADPALTYVETDLEALTAEKRALVDDLRRRQGLPAPPGLRLAAANALELPALEAAVAGLRRDQPLAIVSEGLLQYLSPQELDAVAQNVRALLEAFGGGLWLTPDFSLKDQVAPVTERQRKFRAVVAAATDRQMYDSAFENDAALRAFLARFGFEATQIFQLDEVPALVSPDVLGLPTDTLLRLRPRLKLWLVSPGG